MHGKFLDCLAAINKVAMYVVKVDYNIVLYSRVKPQRKPDRKLDAASVITPRDNFPHYMVIGALNDLYVNIMMRMNRNFLRISANTKVICS